MLKQIKESEKETIQALLQFEELRKKLLEAYDMEDKSELQVTQIPFAAYEMALERNNEEKREIFDRHEKEKEAMRKHYRNIILWISIPFIAFIIAVFCTVAWFLNTYDIMSYSQDSTYGNANFVGNDGDITNGEADYYMGETQEQNN